MLKTEKYEKSQGKLKCDICGTKFRENARIYNADNELVCICKYCNEFFSKEDIKLIMAIFESYGGYYGKYKYRNTSLDDILTDFFDYLSAKNGNLKNVLEDNKKLCHKALLHGYTPQELIRKMKETKK
jgi:hypothetical protein